MDKHTTKVLVKNVEFSNLNHNYKRTSSGKMTIELRQGVKTDEKYGDTGDCLKVFLDGKEVVSFTLDFGAQEIMVPHHFGVIFENEDKYERFSDSVKGYEIKDLKEAKRVLDTMKEYMRSSQ